MPGARVDYISQYWPVVHMALDELFLDYEEMILKALVTIAAETRSFVLEVPFAS